MYIFTACVSDPNFETWKRIDAVVKGYRSITHPRCSYEDMFEWATNHFEFTRMFRNDKSYIQYEFTEEEWIIFKLKWL